jgi:hypothetical protein
MRTVELLQNAIASVGGVVLGVATDDRTVEQINGETIPVAPETIGHSWALAVRGVPLTTLKTMVQGCWDAARV